VVSTITKKIIGYQPDWANTESSIQYSKLTHVNYAFVLPNANGSLQGVGNTVMLQNLVTHGHQNNVKVLVSIGGWNDGNDSNFVALASDTTRRTTFVNAVINMVNQYNLDGVDIDWEFPDPGTESANYSLLMNQLGSALHSRGKLLTAAVVAEGGMGDGVRNDVFDNVDFLNLMAYDANNGNHSPYSYAVQSINYWSNRGLPADKIVLGVPYYARPSWAAYRDIVARNSANACRDSDGSDYWNGIPTIRQKAQLARNYGGIMTWELSQDTSGSNSLVTAMWEAITGRAGSYNCN
jgi:GH18 family chitinase